MAKKSQTKVAAKISANAPAKSSGKAKGAKARAAPLSIGVAKKTSPARPGSTKSRPVNRRTRAKAKPLTAMKRENSLRKQQESTEETAERAETILHQSTEDIGRTPSPASIDQSREEPAVSSLDGKMVEDLLLMEVTAQEAMTKPFEDSIGEVRPRVAAAGAACQVAKAMPHAGMAFNPFGMMVSQHAFGFNLMLNALQMQRRFFDIWRPRHR